MGFFLMYSKHYQSPDVNEIWLQDHPARLGSNLL